MDRRMDGWIDPSVFVVVYRIVHGNGWVLAIFIISSWDVNTLRLTRGLIAVQMVTIRYICGELIFHPGKGLVFDIMYVFYHLGS